MPSFRASIVLALAGFLAAPFLSPAAASPLSGIEKVKVSIASPNEFGEDCGLVTSGLRRAFFEPLADQGVQQVTSGSAYRVYIRTTTLTYDERACLSYVDAQLLLSTRYFDPATRLEQPGTVQLWTRGGLYVSDIDEHAAAVNSALRGFGRMLAGELTTAAQ